MSKLSIIIPAYNAEPYLGELVACLQDQIPTDKSVEVLIIDDGSSQPVTYKANWLKVIRQDNQGVSVARNVGIDKAKGDYISFIDADDLVPDYYVERLLEKTKDEPDVIELSWRSLTKDNWNINQRLRSESDRLPNPSVCTRCFKRSYIGDVRFNVRKDSTEDEDFCRKMGYLDPDGQFKRAVITDYMYFYRDTVSMSKTKRYAAGLMNTKRVVYFYNYVSSDMTWLLDEIKKEDETNEVFLQTNQCDIPELKRYCQISKPIRTWAHIIKGEPCSHLTKKEIPAQAQVVIYRRNLSAIGGLLTFILHFVEQMREQYDIIVLCENFLSQERMMQLLPKVRVIVGKEKPVVCDSLIVLSFLDKLPSNVTAKKVVRMCHACRTNKSWTIPQNYDELVYVSKTAMESFGVTDGNVIHNFKTHYTKSTLLLVSATRLPAEDKGDIETRMRKLCKMMTKAGIEFLWLNFSDGNLKNPPKGFYNMGVSYDMEGIIKKADYVVMLSDSECWSYTVLEALTNGTPLICTPFPSAFEQGVKDGINAHVIPFDMDFDVNILRDVPEFEYVYENETIKEQWLQILGKSKPFKPYKPDKSVLVKVIQGYDDVLLNKHLEKGTEHIMTKQRAQQIINTKQNLIEIIKEL